MQIGILLAGHSPDEVQATQGDFDAMFARLLDGHGFTFTSYDVENMKFPPGVDAQDGWLVTGSRHGAYEDHPFIAPLERFVRDAWEADVPLVGICFGHQIVAQALGGRVEKHAGGWALGNTDYLLASGGTLALNAWHQDQVTALPDGATALARNDFCENAIVAYGRRAFTVQAHPEFDHPTLRDYIAVRRGTGTYPDAMMQAALDGTGRPVQAQAIADAVARFFRTREAHVDA